MVKWNWRQVIAVMTLAVSFNLSTRCWYRLTSYVNEEHGEKTNAEIGEVVKISDVWVSEVQLLIVPPSLCNAVMNHSLFLTSFWKSSKYPGLLQLPFFPRAVPPQQVFFLLFFYSPLTNFLVLCDGSRASLKWEFALFCCSREFKDLWDEKNWNQSRLWLLFLFFF